MKAFDRHYWFLAGIVLLGAGLRFWNLDLKPLWMDEVITALFSFGHTYDQVPLDQALPVSAFEQIFRLNPAATCPQIVTTVATQSVHPPLFFCWMHAWMTGVNDWPFSWVWKLRALPALAGVGAIAATYLLNRALFFPRAGLMGAALMAVSPFGVYLSQEARHYTVPILLVILALLGLYHLLLDLQSRSFRPAIWLGWIAVNSLGFYVHYFFLLAFVAQLAVLALMPQGRGSTGTALQRLCFLLSHLRRPSNNPPLSPAHPLTRSPAHPLIPLLAIITVCLTFFPWLPTFLGHMRRPETAWLRSSADQWGAAIAPLYQIPITWVLMVIALPFEQQPWWIVLGSVLVMVLFALWLGLRVVQGVRRLWQLPETHLGTWMLLAFIAVVVLEFLAIAIVVRKDLTAIPRYSFIYFPALIALIGASLMEPVEERSQWRKGDRGQETGDGKQENLLFPIPYSPFPIPRRKGLRYGLQRAIAGLHRQAIWVVLVAGLVSSLLVTSNFVFQKPYNPERIAQNIRSVEPQLPTLVTMAYSSYQDVAMGLSFALGLQRQINPATPRSPEIYFTLMRQNQGYNVLWRDLSLLQHPLTFPLNLWAISPGLRRQAYRQQLILPDQAGTNHSCVIDPKHFYRIGIPIQRYRCD